MSAYIYKITNSVNGKFYIGSTNNIEKRWYQHKLTLNNNTHGNAYLQNSWRKYGEDSFKFEIIEEVPRNEQFKKEQEYIDKLKPFGDIGFNIVKDVTDAFKRDIISKKCSHCEDDFETYYSHQKYCCNDCERESNASGNEDWYCDWKLNKMIRESNFEDKDIGDWEVHDHIAAWWVDAMEK